jgi:hypothetical protein
VRIIVPYPEKVRILKKTTHIPVLHRSSLVIRLPFEGTRDDGV